MLCSSVWRSPTAVPAIAGTEGVGEEEVAVGETGEEGEERVVSFPPPLTAGQVDLAVRVRACVFLCFCVYVRMCVLVCDRSST